MLHGHEDERRRSCWTGRGVFRQEIKKAAKLFPGAAMPVGLLTLELYIPDAQSLKDKRQVLRSLKDRLRGHFNVAVAELEHQDLWQRSIVGVVGIAAGENFLE